MESDFLQRRDRRRSFYAKSHQARHHGLDLDALRQAKADKEQSKSTPPVSEPSPGIPAQPAPQQHRSLRHWLRTRSRKQLALLIVGIILLVSIIGAGLYYFVFISDIPVAQSVTKKKAIKQAAVVPVIYYSPLTGLPVDQATLQNPVTGVMIENSQTARPQSGLIDAGVVFEAVAEGGITRFLMLFQDTSPEYIGPVRSVRPYYIKWANGFDAAIAHVGGSNQALAMIRGPGGKDLDQFFNTGPYWRISTRPAPHNMYSSVPKLRELQIKKGWGTSKFTGFERKAKEEPAVTPTAKTIDFNISGAIYNSHYDYDAATNSYLRSEGGKPHTDDKSSKQISPKVVIGLVMPQGKDGIYTTYETIGSGHAYVFQDGVVTQGNWEKVSNESQFVFKDSSGAAIRLNPGSTWLTVVGGTDRVSYKP